MTRRSRVWLVVAVSFTLINAAGVVLAARAGEVLHACAHIVLTLVGAYVAWRLVPRRHDAASPTSSSELRDRLTNIEQSVDAVAIEVERIGEGQRFMTRLATEQGAAKEAGRAEAGSGGSEARTSEPGKLSSPP